MKRIYTLVIVCLFILFTGSCYRDDLLDLAQTLADDNKVQMPVFTPAPGYYLTSEGFTGVVISCEAEDAIIIYTTDGSEPGYDEYTQAVTSGSIYTTGTVISITSSTTGTTLKAMAYKEDKENSFNMGIYYIDQSVGYLSITTSATYPYTEPIPITITCTSSDGYYHPDVSIRYTTDGGTMPTSSTGILYSGTFMLDSSAYINAIAYAPGRMSATYSMSYNIQPLVYFTGSGLTISEDNTPIVLTLTVQLSRTSASDITVYYSIDGASTADGSDYTLTTNPGSITIPANTQVGSTTMQITGLSDGLTESDEQIIFMLTSSSGASIGSPNTFMVIIPAN